MESEGSTPCSQQTANLNPWWRKVNVTGVRDYLNLLACNCIFRGKSVGTKKLLRIMKYLQKVRNFDYLDCNRPIGYERANYVNVKLKKFQHDEISHSDGGEYEDDFWDVAPCSLVQYKFIDVLEVLAASIIRVMTNLKQTTRRNMPENCHLHRLR
jgi:hypothetical protein